MQPTAIHHNERVAFIQASWHKEIVDQSRKGFLAEMLVQGYQESDIDFFEVGGAFEIPLHAKLLAKTGRYAGIVGAALVVDGGIYRHDFVAQSVVSGLMQVQLETEVPVFSVSLTPHHFHAGEEHQKFFFEHFVHKGQEAAKTCVDTLQKIRAIKRMDTQQKRAV
ncbi:MULTISPECIES: 6,7-dimethyl-8-ribityllumazine synthase [Pseudomonas]|jgi:6,7-dimethyl-8-ribityllumazine synthase|uniref:6,7-dimethyl-8-ribityllumazine synthase n=1 Tax=Pseudomonas TaxID=286 RepID=UPI000287E60C|nr:MULTISPECIES: 6,7-dimethyl-8-ribityllumazine synthase [Pseudomonas]AMB80673.1 6,7-dimethyl-8-ribityllumazine synthase [Pseudomonas fragi]MCB1655774.1 6,7-dimethyl-8-ribityllumazine synthase [Pseudomonadales bacterium]NBF14085.1 6,7-dimethyl-8-ribityllumazine synthase [Pseudomonas sp. Fl4BN2]MCH4869279.1 6,7-dimethyl-8-ribityllumazine synthase [Pseudomonas sp. TMW22089]NBG93669.1 6,7-dimethyl-8-ribityllumazine synthase [Pseudomonas sp. 9.1(2019)]